MNLCSTRGEMTNSEKPHPSFYDPPAAAAARFTLKTVVAIFTITMLIVMVPLGLLIPAPRTARDAFLSLFKKAAQIVEGRGSRLMSETTIATLYYKHTARRYVQSCICLAMATLLLLVLVAVCKPPNSVSLLYLACAQCVLCALLSVRIRLLRYRIGRGVFGTSPHEVRDTIGFMVHEVDDIDFTDSSGKRRPSLPPEGLADPHSSKPYPEGVRV